MINFSAYMFYLGGNLGFNETLLMLRDFVCLLIFYMCLYLTVDSSLEKNTETEKKRRQIIQISKQRNQQKRERLADRERKVRILMHALNGWNRLFVSD